MRSALIAAILMGVTALPAGAESLNERLQPCLACHGEKGQSELNEVPSLGGQPTSYLLIQLYLFRESQRSFELMNEQAKPLTDADLSAFSDEIAKLPRPAPAADPADGARMARARDAVQKYKCNFCHNPDYSGHDQVPRIAAQREDYLVKTLREYKNNTRHGYEATMAEALQPVSDGEIQDLAYFLARTK
jgi:cytochrome c553